MKRFAFVCVMLCAVSQVYAEPVPWSAGNGWTLTQPPVFTDNPALSPAWADMLYMFNYYSDLMQNAQVEYLAEVQAYKLTGQYKTRPTFNVTIYLGVKIVGVNGWLYGCAFSNQSAKDGVPGGMDETWPGFHALRTTTN